MIGVGIVGLGFMGMVHHRSYEKVNGAKVVAICDRKATRLRGDWTGIKGNFGDPGGVVDLSGIQTYLDPKALLADPNVDLVGITLPPALHADVAIAALRLGKHVLCEKPLALTLTDCDRMLAAAEQSGRKLLAGHVLPFFPEYRWALQHSRSGEHGDLKGGRFERTICDPTWLANYWDPRAVGGPMLDLHVHDSHFIRLLYGMPQSVRTTGTLRNSLPEYWQSSFRYSDDRFEVQATGGVHPHGEMTFTHGFEIAFERATLKFSFAVERLSPEGQETSRYLVPPTVRTADGVELISLMGDGDPCRAFDAELQEAVDSLQGLEPNSALQGHLARDAIKICKLQSKSLLSSRESPC